MKIRKLSSLVELFGMPNRTTRSPGTSSVHVAIYLLNVHGQWNSGFVTPSPYVWTLEGGVTINSLSLCGNWGIRLIWVLIWGIRGYCHCHHCHGQLSRLKLTILVVAIRALTTETRGTSMNHHVVFARSPILASVIAPQYHLPSSPTLINAYLPLLSICLALRTSRRGCSCLSVWTDDHLPESPSWPTLWWILATKVLGTSCSSSSSNWKLRKQQTK